MTRPTLLVVVSLGVLVAISCGSYTGDYSSVRELVRDRSDTELLWHRVDGSSPTTERVTAILAEPIGSAEAVAVGLLNSAELQAALESLAAARGVYLDASLPPNPELEGAIGFPEGDEPTELELGATVSVSQLLLLPTRRAMVAAEVEEVVVLVAAQALDLVYEVRSAFYAYQAAEQVVEVFETVLESTSASLEVARRLHDAGNLTDLDLANEQVFYEEARLALADAELDALFERERLNTLMGLTGELTRWRLAGRLELPPDALPPIGELEARAVERSLDLWALERRYEAAARSANLARAEGVLPDLRAGVRADREEDVWSVGPAVTLELPVFNWGRGRVQTAHAQARQIELAYTARAVSLRAAVRAARDRLVTAQRRADHYRTRILPLRQQIVDETQRQYNAMQVGVFQLIDARRAQIEAGQHYVAALREYWAAKAALDQILAGRFVPIGDASSAPDDSPMAAPRGENP